jgi:hypothetical protein
MNKPEPKVEPKVEPKSDVGAQPTIQPPVVQNTAGMVLASVVIVTVVGAAAVVSIILLRPKEDNTLLIASVLGFLGPTAAALLALIKSAQTGAAVQDLHLAVNSRLTQLLELTAASSKSEGRLESDEAAKKEKASEKDNN